MKPVVDHFDEERRNLSEMVRSLKAYLVDAKELKKGPMALTTKERGGERLSVDVIPEQPGSIPRLLIEDIRADTMNCQRCPLWSARRTIVFGEGHVDADLLFVGEGPGEEEDRQGKPFVGRAGQLLTKIIAAMGLTREDVYIANIVKCRPPGNRNPKPEEADACTPYLLMQIEAIRPRVICALGSVAARYFLKSESPVSILRGRFHEFGGIPLMVTYHPAYLLRNPGAKKQVWEDVQQIVKFLADDRR